MTKWSEHVKKYAKKHKMSYRDASMDSKCKESYRKMSKRRMSPKKRMSPRKMSKKKGRGNSKRMNNFERKKRAKELGDALIIAAGDKDNNQIEMGVLIQQGADVNYEDPFKETPADRAISQGHFNNLRFLLDNDAYLSLAHLEGADLEGADLSGEELNGSVLTDANLANANLKNVSLDYATLTNANLEGAILEGAILEGADLTNAKIPERYKDMIEASGARNIESIYYV